MYNQKEKADKVSKVIELTKEKYKYRHSDINAINAKNDWAAPHLLSKLLFESELVSHTYISPEELNVFHKEFGTKNGTIDLTNLINKFWIRIIGGMIEIPSGISSAARQYEKIKDTEAEFNFLTEAAIHFKLDAGVEKAKFLAFLDDYQKKKRIIISLEKCKLVHLLEDKEEKIKIFKDRKSVV